MSTFIIRAVGVVFFSVGVFIWLESEPALIVFLRVVALEESVVLLFEDDVVRVPETDSNSEVLPKHELTHIKTRHIEEGVVLFEEKNSGIGHGRVGSVCVFKYTHITCALFSENGPINQEITQIEKELFLYSVLCGHCESEVGLYSWIYLVTVGVELDPVKCKYGILISHRTIRKSVN